MVSAVQRMVRIAAAELLLGHTPGIVQPSQRAQAELIRATYGAAGLSPHGTELFEAHGTGTALGDPLEVGALSDALDTRSRDKSDPVCIGVRMFKPIPHPSC